MPGDIMKTLFTLITGSAIVISCYFLVGNTSTHANSKEQTLPLESIPVPNAFRPEGIVKGYGDTVYVGSLASGSIFQVDLSSGEGEILVDNEGGVAVGLTYDKRTNYIYVAGGASGTINVYDGADGQLKKSYILSDENGFINDGIITKKAAYFTNSKVSEFYRIPLNSSGKLPDQNQIETIKLSENIDFIEGSFNSNGIETTPDGKNLIIVNSTTGKLFKVNPLTGEGREIIISNGNVQQGDGLLRRANRLFVVQNRANQIAEIILDKKCQYAEISRIITNPLFRVPTTITRVKDELFAINARFGVIVDENTDYDIVRVSTIDHFSHQP